jgi:hypothetical protein
MSFTFWIALFAVAPVAVALPLSFVPPQCVLRLSTTSIWTQIALALTAWALFLALPRTGFDSCLAGSGRPLLALVWFASFGIGAIAASSSIIGAMQRAAGPGRIVAGLFAHGLTIFAAVPFIVAAFCDFN